MSDRGRCDQMTGAFEKLLEKRTQGEWSVALAAAGTDIVSADKDHIADFATLEVPTVEEHANADSTAILQNEAKNLVEILEAVADSKQFPAMAAIAKKKIADLDRLAHEKGGEKK